MRPVHLKLSGLQSYREAQEIDFTALTEAGVFGIFGPTGSGKSSILDAITLALYGKVERAPLGTQGIMNQFEQALTVAFTFELSGASGKKRYRVERQYKRTGDVSVSNTVCRFVHVLPEGEQVAADKQADVNQCVEELIGLSMQDFTRAVVLPQGKFAEFLSLKGGDRRQMLQRLFHLEAYGDVLNGRLSHRAKQTNLELKQTEAEQQGLGEASAEALKEAEFRLKQAVETAAVQRKRLEECRQAYERLKMLRERQQEQQNVLNQLAVLEAAEPELAGKERKLVMHASADRILPVLTEWLSAKAALEQASLQLVEANRAKERAFALHEQAKLASEQAQQALAGQEGELLLRLNQLKQAKELQNEMDQLRKETEELTARQQVSRTRLAELEKSLAKERAMLDKAYKRQGELQEALKAVEVRPEDRRRLQLAAQRRQELLSLRKQQAAAAEEAARKAAALGALQQAEAALLREEQACEAVFTGLAAELAAAGIAADAGAAELQLLLAAVPQQLEQAQAADRSRSAAALAAQLAAHLHDGTPCPVCGSSVHPQPARESGAAPEEGAAQQLQQLLDRVRGLVPEAKQLRLLHTGLAAQLAELLPQAAYEAAAASSLQLSPASEAFDVPDLPTLASRTDRLEKLLQQHLREASELSGRQRTAMQTAEAARRKRHTQEAEQKALRAVVEEAERKHTGLAKDVADSQQIWTVDFPELTEEEALASIEKLAEQDKQAQAIRESLEKSVPFIENTRTAIEQHQAAAAACDKDTAQIDAVLSGKQQLLQEKGERLVEWTAGQPVDTLLSEASSRLEQLRKQGALTKEELEKTAAALQEASNLWNRRSQSEESAETHKQKCYGHWAAAVETSPFRTADEVREAALPEETVTAWTEEIRLHRERQHALRGQLEHISAALSGDPVTTEQWEEAVMKRNEAQEADEKAVRERAKAERDLEEMLRRHEKWKGLEQRRNELQSLHNRLQSLQSVFRGNAFVEYIAEEQLIQVSRAASERLGFLTRQRYALEVDSSGGFVIRDDANGGLRRPVSTLSGGETFLTSLALALALSGQIQLRGQFPLEFFFLDEGFGTLDQDLLDTVISSLEKLHTDQLSVGVISHVPELRARLPRKLIVTPAEPSGKGSRIHTETL
ncbi:AAA family ATPase [Paenibacillus gansuensis]|uniref:Nuclease SbcCD subunit C n=1 Tax=Paenibacillus gansuensis TaxID=306542 RepID=A0ABW5PBQ0_9BACL